MAELPPLDRLDPEAPLGDVKVVEIAGELSGYAGRLLFDLGAEVTRISLVQPADESPPQATLLARTPDPAADAEACFLHRGKMELALDPSSAGDLARLEVLIASADVLIQSGGADSPRHAVLEPAAVRAANPAAIHAVLTPFGLDGPAADCVSTDLIRLAAGGLLWLGGYPDSEPVAPFGGQSTSATAIFGTVAVLLALIDRDKTGAGRMLEISSQEVMVQALETSIAEYELTGRVQRRLGDTPREAGTGVYPCADGFVSMVAGRLGTAQAWTRLREWLVEEGTPGAAELWGEGWDELAFRQRPETIARFGEIFGEFARRYGKQELYLEAQRRSIAVAPVNDLTEVLADPQLLERGSLIEVELAGGARGMVPAPPYRFSPLEPETLAAEGASRPGALAAPSER